MSSLYTYLEQYGQLSFQEEPFNELDAAIILELTYLPIDRFFTDSMDFKDGLTFKHLARLYQPFNQYFQETDQTMANPFRSQLIKKIADYRRFKNLRISGFLNSIDFKLETQSAFLLVDLGNNFLFVSFRGTDDMIVGWKEDIILTYQSSIPAQIIASQYLEKVIQAHPTSHLIIGGHSKGGHLALYAASQMSLETISQIKLIYTLDSPGFHTVNLRQNKMKRVNQKHIRIIPEDSIIGNLLFHDQKAIIIKSKKRGLMQHNLANWKIEGKQFQRAKQLTITSQSINQINKNWILRNSPARRKRIISALIDLIDACEAQSINQLINQPTYYLNKVHYRFRQFDPSLQKDLRDFAKQYIQFFRNDLRQYHLINLNQSIIEARKNFKQMVKVFYNAFGSDKKKSYSDK
ncbi:Mbeg1-like protein [Facklamia sp. P13069]|uniref:Mbeg1-like protein n=1 Tax=Facklamia sp. P13069 TaxID=3421954 RepID=UPI003D1826D4